MLIAALTVSIRPGGTPAVKAALAERLRPSPLAAAPVVLATEIGEVNTLTCLFPCRDAGVDLAALREWAAGLRASEVAAQLRAVRVELFTGDEAAALQTLVAPGVEAVLLQEIAAGGEAGDGLRLRALTGEQGLDWRLIPVASPDAALELSVQALRAEPELRHSRLLLPVR
jgi:hypothetical protein